MNRSYYYYAQRSRSLPAERSTAMTGAITLVLLATVIGIGTAHAGDGNGYRSHVLLLSSKELFRVLESPSQSKDGKLDETSDKILDFVENETINVRPFFTLLPSKAKEGEARPPTFALIAKAKDSTVISLTRPGVSRDPEEQLFLQRTVVSNFFDRRGFSVSVYEDHALEDQALRFVGIGGRFMARPKVRVFGWGLRLNLFGSFHPKHGATAYFAVTGSPGFTDHEPPPDPMD